MTERRGRTARVLGAAVAGAGLLWAGGCDTAERSTLTAAALGFRGTVVDGALPGLLDNKAVGDLDGDGLPDIVIGTDSQLVWYQAPTWARRELASGHNFTTDMQVADVDGDGDADVVTPHYDAGQVVWYRNPRIGGGGWAPVEIGSAGTAHDLEVGDVDGDGRLDVVTRGHGGPTTLFRQADPSSWQVATIAAAPPSEGTALADVDRDGRLDIVQNGYWLAAPADVVDGGSWTRHDFASGWDDGYVGVAVGDLNGDGRLDVALARSEAEGRMAWYEAPADPRAGGWAEHQVDDDVDFVHTFKTADMDGDGDRDVVFAEMLQSSRRRVGIYVNGGGGLSWTLHLLSAGGSQNIRVADIGGDGDLDVVGANWQGAPVELWENLAARPETAPPPPGPGPTTPTSASAPAGYWMLGRDGAVYAFGASAHLGAPSLGAPATDLEPTPTGAGYWIVDEAGATYAYGDAPWAGRAGALARNETVTSLSATPSGKGYWLFTSRGRALTFGDAPFLGDLGAVGLNGPVLDSVPTPSGRGYSMVAADGGVFAFGDAAFHGSMGAARLNAPVQSLVPDGDGDGYWLVASDGGVFAFGAPFRGSMGASRLNGPVTGMVRYGDGYLMVGSDGGIFTFSDRPFLGSLGERPPARPIVAVASYR